MIKAIVFDLDGVVFLEEELFSDMLNREYGIDYDDLIEFFENDFQSCLKGHADLKHLLESKYFDKWGWKFGVHKFLELWFNNGRINQNIVDLIKALNQKGYDCILCTNNERYKVEYLSKKFGFEQLFEHVIASHSVGSKKPERRMFEKITELSKCNPDQILFCDDDKRHVNAAKAFGFHGIEFNNIEQLKREIRDIGEEEDYSNY